MKAEYLSAHSSMTQGKADASCTAGISASGRRRRQPHSMVRVACDPCRVRKSSCDGARPICSACARRNQPCRFDTEFADDTRFRALRRQHQNLQERLTAYEEINPCLRGLSLEQVEAINLSKHRSGASAGSTSTSLEAPRLHGGDIGTELLMNTAGSSSRGSSSSPDITEDVEMVQWPPNRNHIGPAIPYERGTGFAIFCRLRRLCGDLAGCTSYADEVCIAEMVRALDAPISNQGDQLGTTVLPTEGEVSFWVETALNEAFSVQPFIQRAAVKTAVYCCFQSDLPVRPVSADWDNLALLHVLVALGQQWNTTTLGSAKVGEAAFMQQDSTGLKHFAAATRIIDASNCDRSLVALQTMMCCAIFAKAAGAHSLCHNYTSAATSTALRMRLHKVSNVDAPGLQALKTRIWSTVCVLETHTTILLGIPSQIDPRHTLLEISGQRFPLLPDSRDNIEVSFSNAHARLCDIIRQIPDFRYAYNSGGCGQVGTHSVNPRAITAVDDRLRHWAQAYSLPADLLPENASKPQLLLELAHEHARLLLYAPFVHHNSHSNSAPGQLFAEKCTTAAIRLVRVMEVLEEQQFLNPAHSPITHSLVFASIVLLLTELGDSGPADISRSTEAAKNLLDRLSLHCEAVAGALKTLIPLFECIEYRRRLTASFASGHELLPVENVVIPTLTQSFPVPGFDSSHAETFISDPTQSTVPPELFLRIAPAEMGLGKQSGYLQHGDRSETTHASRNVFARA